MWNCRVYMDNSDHGELPESRTLSPTSKDQREFEQLTNEEEKVNRDDFTWEVDSSRERFVYRKVKRGLWQKSECLYKKNHPLYDSTAEVNMQSLF